MKRGKEIRDSEGQPTKPGEPKEISVIIGLGDYGKTLTVLWADSLPEPEELEETEENDEENLLPSQRWRERE